MYVFITISLDVLDFVGSDESGSFSEALHVTVDGGQYWVLLQGYPQDSNYVYQKEEFGSRDDLAKAFPYGGNGYGGCGWSTGNTDRSCGYGLTDKIFEEAIARFRATKAH